MARKPAAAPGELNELEQRFVREYLVDLNQAAAMQRADGSKTRKSWKELGYRMMQRPLVKAAIEARMQRGLSRLDVTVDRVLTERARLAFFDPRKLFREDGTPIPPNELDDDTARALAGIKFDAVAIGRGKARKVVSTISEYKLPNKGENLTALDKYLGLYREEASNVGVLNIHLHLD